MSTLLEILINVIYAFIGTSFGIAVNWGLGGYILDQYIEMLFDLRKEYHPYVMPLYRTNRKAFHRAGMLGYSVGFFVLQFGSQSSFVIFLVAVTTYGWIGWLINSTHLLSNLIECENPANQKIPLRDTDDKWELFISTFSLWLLSAYASASIVSSVFEQLNIFFMP